MPKVNVKYQLDADATVTVQELKFQSEDAGEIKKNNSEVILELKLTVDDQIQIKLLMSGFGEWTLAVWVIELEGADNHQTGKWIPCADNGLSKFTGNASETDLLQGNFKISWP